MAGDGCGAFHIVALEPSNSAFITAGRLTRGSDDELFYRCKYEMPIPHSRRIMIQPGMGPVDKYNKDSEYYRTQWIGGPKPYGGGVAKFPDLITGNVQGGPSIPYAAYRIDFADRYKYVTVGTAKATSLSFEIGFPREIGGRVRTDSGRSLEWGLFGHRVDWCLNFATACGKPAADAYCRLVHFKEAKSFTGPVSLPLTVTLGDNRVCKGGSCGGFETITCVKD